MLHLNFSTETRGEHTQNSLKSTPGYSAKAQCTEKPVSTRTHQNKPEQDETSLSAPFPDAEKTQSKPRNKKTNQNKPRARRERGYRLHRAQQNNLPTKPLWMNALDFTHDVLVVRINQFQPLRPENACVKPLRIINYEANIIVPND